MSTHTCCTLFSTLRATLHTADTTAPLSSHTHTAGHTRCCFCFYSRRGFWVSSSQFSFPYRGPHLLLMPGWQTISSLSFPAPGFARIPMHCFLCASHDRCSSRTFPFSPPFISPKRVSQSPHSPCIRDLHAFYFPCQAAAWQVQRRVGQLYLC